MSKLRVGLDATPLTGQRTGVGRYIEGLLSGLDELGEPIQPVLTTFSMRSGRPTISPDSKAVLAPRQFPARFLLPAWERSEQPRIEILTGRIDVFHGTNFIQPPARAAGVLTVHDLTFVHHADTVTPAVLRYRELVPRGIARSKLVICFTEAIAAEIAAEYPISRDRIRVIPHGVDPSWQRARALSAEAAAALGLPERYLLAVGTLEPRKNLGLLIAAHAAARKAQPDDVPPLVLVGGIGWGDRFGDAQPDPGNVVLAGYLDDVDLKSMVAGAVAVCMPSRYEGFGLPVLEALAAGRPVLASDIPAHREVGGAVATFLPFDTDAWSQALIDVATAGRETGAVTARRKHTWPFTWRRSAIDHLQTYNDALN